MESFKLTVSCWTASIPYHLSYATPLELQSLGWPHHTTSCHALSIATQYCLVHAHSRIRSSTGTHYSSQYLLEIQQVYAQQRQLPQLPRACDGTDQTSLKGCHCHSLHVTAVPPTSSVASYQPSMPCPSPTRSCTQTRPACACIPQLHGTLLTGRNTISEGALTNHTSVHTRYHSHSRLMHHPTLMCLRRLSNPD
jgi:hypothetical protein